MAEIKMEMECLDDGFDGNPLDEISDGDIIARLYERDLHHVLKQIFSYLDLESMLLLDNVSKSWQPIWKIFFNSKVSAIPLWRKMYNVLLSDDEARFPEKREMPSKEMPHQAIFTACQKLEDNWEMYKAEYRYSSKDIKCDSVDANAALHCEISDDFIALKNKRGVLKVWNRKTGLLENEFQSNPEPPNTYGTYALGGKLVFCSDLFGIIHVWDMIQNKITFEITNLKGANINSLHFDAGAGILIASSNRTCKSRQLTMWTAIKKQRGQFVYWKQYTLPGVEVLQILGWSASTFGVMCKTPHSKQKKWVHIYTHSGEKPELVSTILLEERSQVDWADGFFIVAHLTTIRLYNVATGLCIQTIEDDSFNEPHDFLERDLGYSVCASQITAYIHDDVSYCCEYFYRWKITEGFLNSARKKSVEENGVMEYCKVGLLVDKFKADELQSVIMTLGEPNLDGEISANFHLVDFYPACNSCGNRKLIRENCKRCECYDVIYCSKSCLEADREQHKLICQIDL